MVELAESKGPEGPSEEEYELLPHKEVTDLKEQLERLKTFEVAPTKKLTVNLIELNAKIDRLLTVFEEASKQISVEEGGLSFEDRMKPVLEKMNRILQQNAEIAEGIVAVADIVKEFKSVIESKGILGAPMLESPLTTSLPATPPPPPPRRKLFGL
ncbi:hypothetical protein HY490_04330 [Candidatus Woesearchaeota archaeon]|nr:hypothetical protein [Candidatus Woesearchaeota archaeon]